MKYLYQMGRQLGVMLVAAGLFATASAQNVLPRPDPAFHGKIGLIAKESTPDFPQPQRAAKGSPNIVLIMTDDVGFGASSTFGGPIATPTMDGLAKQGVRYNQFHTTALCSPTRAALLTGRNHHTAATGVITEMATGYPGYNSLMPKSVGSIAEVLKQSGYSTSWFGKNHNVPAWQASQDGPFDLWPTGLGFDYFYGFIGGDTNQWRTALFENTRPIQAPEQMGKNPEHLDQLLADKAIGWVRTHHALNPDKPFFLYYTPGSAHAPHHAPKDWIAKFKGQFDQGWDKVREETFARQKQLGIIPQNAKLTPMPAGVPAWDTLDSDQKKVYARMMEVYAAALSHADTQVGRLLEEIADEGELDNTIVMYIQGDNGASAEGSMQGTTDELATAVNGVTESMPYLVSMMDELGGEKTYNHYPVGWALAMDTPYQWTKQVASHFGGTRNGMVISWPGHIQNPGSVRSQFHHVIDVVPTILDVTGLKFPEEINGVKQKPIEGTSMAYTFNKPNAPSTHTTQYFELVGNRGIYQDGWIASTTPARIPWINFGMSPNPEDFKWELYKLTEDFTQSNDVAALYPEKLKQLQAVFDQEARAHDVYPLDASFGERGAPNIRPSLTGTRQEFTYYPGMIRIPEGSAPNMKNKNFSIVADIEIPAAGASGIIATQGGRFGGWGLMLLNGKPLFVHNVSNQEKDHYRIVAKDAVKPGKHTLRFDFSYDGGGIGKGGTGVLSVDNAAVATGHIDRTVRVLFSFDETFDVGEDTGTPVIDDYEDLMPFRFSGTLKKVKILLGQSAANLPKLTYVRD